MADLHNDKFRPDAPEQTGGVQPATDLPAPNPETPSFAAALPERDAALAGQSPKLPEHFPEQLADQPSMYTSTLRAKSRRFLCRAQNAYFANSSNTSHRLRIRSGEVKEGGATTSLCWRVEKAKGRVRVASRRLLLFSYCLDGWGTCLVFYS